MTDRELMQMALDALMTCQVDWVFDGEDERPVDTYDKKMVSAAFKALRARLAQPEQEPVAWVAKQAERIPQFFEDKKDACALLGVAESELISLYTAPPQRVWQGLTDEEIQQTLWKELGIGQDDDEIAEFARAIEAKLKEKNA